MVISSANLCSPFGGGGDLGSEAGSGEAPLITYVPMQKEHLDGVLAIEAVSFPTPWSRQSFEYEVENNLFARYLVALQGEQVVGYGGMWTIMDEAHVTNIAIKPEFRQRGLGRRLLAKMIEWAAQLGCHQMTLEVRVSNHAARKLYESFGFSQRGVRKGYYTDNKEDALIMWKDDLPVGSGPETGGCSDE